MNEQGLWAEGTALCLYLFACTQLSSEVGGVTHPSTTLLTGNQTKKQGSQPKAIEPGCTVALVAVGKREEGGGTFEPQ